MGHLPSLDGVARTLTRANFVKNQVQRRVRVIFTADYFPEMVKRTHPGTLLVGE